MVSCAAGIERLLTRPVTIQHRTHPGDVDAYGVETTTTTTTVTVGYLEQTVAVEVIVDQETYRSDWLLVLGAGTTIDETDRVITDDGTFDVIGRPARVWTPRGEHHVEARLRLVTG